MELDVGGQTRYLGDVLNLVAQGPVASEAAAYGAHQTVRDARRQSGIVRVGPDVAPSFKATSPVCHRRKNRPKRGRRLFVFGRARDPPPRNIHAAPRGVAATRPQRDHRHALIPQVHRCAAKRISNINADLPKVQWRTLDALGGFLLMSCLLVSFDAPWLEAGVFAAGTGALAALYLVLRDLSDPFGGHWSVCAAEEAIAKLVVRLGGGQNPRRRSVSPPPPPPPSRSGRVLRSASKAARAALP